MSAAHRFFSFAHLRQRAASRMAAWWLAAIGFAESLIFPLPTDLLLVPMALAQPARALRFACIATLFSVLGGLAGYGIGLWLMEGIGGRIVSLYGMEAQLEMFASLYQTYGGWAVLLAALTPIPYKLAALASGALGLPVLVFLLASLVGRGLRFFVLAFLCQLVGARLEAWLLATETSLMRVMMIVVLLLMIGALGWFMAGYA